ncbi:hypothetical protein [Methanofollis sp. W23]|uniref:hypothetical protein n=1 Tax=Methanofollis sp. W23 TaxID=2817849 RepID=UPI001AE9DC93|nr:hypothetical protein [Methanofollis sp. W23]
MSIIGVLLVFCLVFATGCTTTPQPAADDGQTTPAETTAVPTQTTAAATNATGPATNMTGPAAAATPEPTPALTTAPTAVTTPAPQPEVIIDEGTAVYAGSHKVYDLCEEEDVEFQYPGDHYTIEIRSDDMINILLLKSSDKVSLCSKHGPWNYDAADPMFQYEEITKKKIEYTIEKVGKYYLYLDGRIIPDDINIIGDSSPVDIKVTKEPNPEYL